MEKAIEKQAGTIIGPSVKIQGDISSDGSIQIEGQITGTVNSNQSVFIGKNAKLTADITANEADISGEVQGKLIISGLLILQATARVSGEITCPVMRMEDGAVFSGICSVNGNPK
jgi:cytoskeletal protein CcmA (bactofilin family)